MVIILKQSSLQSEDLQFIILLKLTIKCMFKIDINKLHKLCKDVKSILVVTYKL